MNATHLDVGGVRYHVAADEAELSAIVRQIYAKPAWRILRGCGRCATVCTEARMCGCCEKIHHNIASEYPDDDKRHVDLLSTDEFLQRAERALAAGAA